MKQSVILCCKQKAPEKKIVGRVQEKIRPAKEVLCNWTVGHYQPE